MCAAPTGSHFSASGRTGSTPAQPSTHQTARPSQPVARPNASDTFAGMPAVSGFSEYAPNGSASSPMRPVYAGSTGAGETEEFLAIASASQQQPQLEPSERPVSAPANPLVAAKMANSAQAGSDAGLFPIQEVDSPRNTKSFDTTFGEPRSKKTGIVVAIVIVAVVAVFAAAYIYITGQETAQAKAKLDSAVESLASTNQVISDVDAAVSDQMSTGAAGEALSRALEQTTTTQNSLSSAETDANDALASSARLTDEETDAANAVLASVSARRSMLEAARQIQTATAATSSASDTLTQVYDLIDKAAGEHSYANELWTSYIGGGDISWLNPQDILDNEMAAYNDDQAALQVIAQAKEAGSTVDFTALETYLGIYGDYLNARYTHNSLYIAGDVEGADANLDWFNAASANLDAAGATLPWSVADYLAAYGPADSSVDAYVSNYSYARDKLVAADATVDAYSGAAPAVTGSLPEAAPAQDAAADESAEPAADDAAADPAAEAPADEAQAQEGEGAEAAA